MEIGVVSVSNTNITTRERVSFTDFKKIEFQSLLNQQGISQCVIVSTCNRSEVYAFANTDALGKLKKIYCDFFAISLNEVKYLQGKDAMCQLMLVTCGLQSILVGEDQIFKQVKQAYQFACIHNAVHANVHYIFQSVFRIVKQMKHTYRISEHPRSTSYIAMKFLKQHVNLSTSSYLLCGGGDIIKQCLPYIASASTIFVALRDPNTQQFAKKYPQIHVIPFAMRHVYLQKVDVLISATSSPHTIFEAEDFISRTKELWILDLALPRDVEYRIVDAPHTHIYNIDDVQHVVEQHVKCKQSIYEQMYTDSIKNAEQLYQASIQIRDIVHKKELQAVLHHRKRRTYDI